MQRPDCPKHSSLHAAHGRIVQAWAMPGACTQLFRKRVGPPVISTLSFSQTPGRSLRRSPVSHVPPPIDNFSKDSRLAQIDRQRRAERNSDFRSTMAALGGSPVRFHLAKSRNCGLYLFPRSAPRVCACLLERARACSGCSIAHAGRAAFTRPSWVCPGFPQDVGRSADGPAEIANREFCAIFALSYGRWHSPGPRPRMNRAPRANFIASPKSRRTCQAH